MLSFLVLIVTNRTIIENFSTMAYLIEDLPFYELEKQFDELFDSSSNDPNQIAKANRFIRINRANDMFGEEFKLSSVSNLILQ